MNVAINESAVYGSSGTATIPDLEEIARWILSCSPWITVKAPEELREMVCNMARKVITLTGSKGK